MQTESSLLTFWSLMQAPRVQFAENRFTFHRVMEGNLKLKWGL
jgi:hypothetical protein